jgi:SAM-dependent methyltransferase
MTGSAIPQVIETAFYDLIADSRISGIVHSQKRTMILDAGCLLIHLSRMLRIEGRVFDIGCHVGYHASLLAAETGLPVHGIDISTRAIAEATRRAKAAPELTFDSTSLDAPDLRAAFDLVYAVRSLPLTPDTAATVARLLRPGGVAVFLPFEPPDVDHSTIEKIAATGLGFALCDVVVGWEGPGRSFDAGLAAVFLKGCDRPMIGDVAERAQDTWNGHFKAYANSPSTQGDEKTQAYCRGYWQASHSG